MISAEVQRTLVKSPPELWAELSDEDALARHLGELGEVKITTTKPEQTVEWEAEAAHGRVELKPSGWGTKVTLSITREAHIEAHRAPGAEQVQEPSPKAEVEPAREPKGAAGPEREADVERAPKAAVESQPEAAMEERSHATAEPPALEEDVAKAAMPTAKKPARGRGFFARLFHRRSAPATVEVTPPSTEEPSPAAESTASTDPAIPAKQGATEKQSVDLEPPSADLAAELAVGEEEIVQQTTELLNGVLDRLGAAHHRPFSRA